MVSYQEPDQDERTRHIREYDKRRQQRADRLFHWSLNMPPEDDGVNNVGNRSGMGWKELAVIAALVAGVGYVASLSNTAPGPQDAEYDVIFYDDAGNKVRLDRWTGE